MFTKLTLERFKNFKKAELDLGPVTSLIGTNASGKSNLRDAFRFLHGVGRSYTLPEIMGDKYGEGGELQWRGIRGGTRELSYFQADSCKLTLNFDVYSKEDKEEHFNNIYCIEVKPGFNGESTERIGESFYIDDAMMFDFFISKENSARIIAEKGSLGNFTKYQPILTQILAQLVKHLGTKDEEDKLDRGKSLLILIYELTSRLGSMRFFDLNPHAMRLSSFPGQTVLGDRGENLSSVLQAICEDQQQKKALLEWIRELTPMDVSDFEFVPDQTGKILLTLVEENGRRTSAYSASDGTLRFLAIIAALLGPKPAKLLFFEELENGLHPSRLHLLLQLMERKASEGNIQIINTTHSPQFLRFLSPEALEYASLTYRLPDTSEGRIKRILDIPDAQRLIGEQDIANLHESGWFEDAMFLDEVEVME